MSKVDDRFTAVVDDNKQKRARPRGPGCGGQAEKYKQNRGALDVGDKPVAKDSRQVFPNPSDDKIDVFLSDQDGFLDPREAAPKKHFGAIDDNIEDIERKMMADAPKAQEGTYKIEDIFDQSYKDSMKEGKSVVSESISTEDKGDDDEFDVF